MRVLTAMAERICSLRQHRKLQVYLSLTVHPCLHPVTVHYTLGHITNPGFSSVPSSNFSHFYFCFLNFFFKVKLIFYILTTRDGHWLVKHPDNT
jgi:hypothetical protein